MKISMMKRNRFFTRKRGKAVVAYSLVVIFRIEHVIKSVCFLRVPFLVCKHVKLKVKNDILIRLNFKFRTIFFSIPFKTFDGTYFHSNSHPITWPFEYFRDFQVFVDKFDFQTVRFQSMSENLNLLALHLGIHWKAN